VWKPTRILVSSDFTSTADAAVRVADDIARRSGAALDFAHVVDDRPLAHPVSAAIEELLGRSHGEGERERALAEVSAAARRAGVSGATPHVGRGDPATEIVTLRDRLGVDLLVLGARGARPLQHLLLGSVADRVLRHPGPPLLLVHESPPGGEFKNILVGVELAGPVTPWLRISLSLAHLLRAEVVVLHALPPIGYLSDRRHVELHPERAPAEIEHAVAEIDPTIPVDVEVERGDPLEVIPRVAKRVGAELVVVGAERHLDGWPGRVADGLARHGLPALLLVWPEPQ
jgi:nucleotide-binding universal stress UspA family protein